MMPGNSQLSAELTLFCQQRGKTYVLLGGSDIDFSPDYKTDPDKLDLYSVPYALKAYTIEHADALIVQSERQVELLRHGYERSAVVIKNPIDLTYTFPRNPSANTILWVGKSDERTKRPSLILELARRLPEYDFVVIMTEAVPDTFEQCVKEAGDLPNVTLVDRVPFQHIEQYFATAKLHVNTSVFEGFPNTFLQAAKYGLPTLALNVDPGEMLSRHGCGRSCQENLDRLETCIRQFMTDQTQYAEASARSLDYVQTHHDINKIVPQFEQQLAAAMMNATQRQ